MNISYKQRLLNIEAKGTVDDQKTSIGWRESGHEIGEFAFPYVESWEWDDLIEYWNSELEKVDDAGIFEGIQARQLSSKSGVHVFLELSTDPLDFVFSYVDSESTQEEMSEHRDYILEGYHLWKEEWKAYEKLMAKAEELVKAEAVGERSGCFSNGEVVFQPINTDRTGYTQEFTPYYNPNA